MRRKATVILSGGFVGLGIAVLQLLLSSAGGNDCLRICLRAAVWPVHRMLAAYCDILEGGNMDAGMPFEVPLTTLYWIGLGAVVAAIIQHFVSRIKCTISRT